MLYLSFAFGGGPDFAPGPYPLLLGRGYRFFVVADWSSPTANDQARPVFLTADTGAFHFFDDGNLELFVKVLDECSMTGTYWVFVSGLTDLGVSLTVIDQRLKTERSYSSPLGATFRGVADLDSFPCE